MTERSVRKIRLPAVCLTLAAIVALACAAPPKKGADRFLGTFRWRQDFGSQAIAFEKGGKAKYITVLPSEGDSSEMKARASTYTVVADTVSLVVDWGHPDTENSALTLVLRGDSLIMLNQVFGMNPVFMREQ